MENSTKLMHEVILAFKSAFLYPRTKEETEAKEALHLLRTLDQDLDEKGQVSIDEFLKMLKAFNPLLTHIESRKRQNCPFFRTADRTALGLTMELADPETELPKTLIRETIEEKPTYRVFLLIQDLQQNSSRRLFEANWDLNRTVRAGYLSTKPAEEVPEEAFDFTNNPAYTEEILPGKKKHYHLPLGLEDYKGPSLSVGDVVEIEDILTGKRHQYLCESHRWQKRETPQFQTT